jgi:NAD(P)-dependent dehydrogenase (short-subunit alcohol dehydrogenase family)
MVDRDTAAGAGKDARVVLITGAASGLGEAIARKFSREGCRVVISDIDRALGTAVAADLRASFLTHDVSSESDWLAILDCIRRDYGRLDVLINNAGITVMGSIEDLDVAAFRRTLEVDLVSVFLGCKTAIPLLAQSGAAAIVNISSVAGLRASANLAAYNAAKAGMTLLSKSIALHCAAKKYAIRCNTVHPGVIQTAMLQKVMAQVDDPKRLMQNFVDLHPIGHIGEPADVAEMVWFLAGPNSKFVTGAEFIVDGGRLL